MTVTAYAPAASPLPEAVWPPLLESGTPGTPRHAFCVTLYNETVEPFRSTICSLLLSVLHFQRNRELQPHQFTLCVVADGRGRIDPAVLELFNRCEVTCDSSGRMLNGVDVYVSRHPTERLLGRLDALGAKPGQCAQEVEVVICLKHHNVGKLHSHSFFFDTLCRQMQPTYCYQVDTGTCMLADTIMRLTDRFERAPDIAAIAPRVVPSVPKSSDSFLRTWQFTDLAFRNGITWPAEVSSGFLSVIPGQTGVFRWQALQSPAGPRPGRVASTDALDAYLEGLYATDVVQRMMYLAEDRVIGIQLYFAHRSHWRLDFLPEAAVTTDSCETLMELLRQRRRWNNSALACRLWLARHFKAFIGRADRTTPDKARFCGAFLLQAVIAVRDFLAPAHLTALLLVFATPRSGAFSAAGRFLLPAFWATIALDVMFVLWQHRARRPLLQRIGSVGRQVCGWLGAALLLFLIIGTLPPVAAAILLAPCLVLAPLVMVLPRQSFPLLVKTQFSPLPNLLTVVLTQLYGFWHLSDISWGTKGLRQAALETGAIDRLRRFRTSVVAIWIALNGLLALYAATSPGILSPSLNPVIEIACFIDTLFAVMALLHLVRHRRAIRRRRVHDSHASSAQRPFSVAKSSSE